MAYIICLSVHDIVDVLLRRGHIDTRIFNQSSMQEGTRLHALYQKEQQDGYIAEYSLSHKFHQEEYTYIVSGKADGVLINPDDKKDVTVEEIKTTVADLDEFIKDHGEWHLGQAMFYGYMIAKERNLSSVTILMTYLKQQNYHESKQIRQVYTFEELERFVEDLILRYTRYQKKLQKFKKIRDQSCIGLKFPFGTYRKGQEEMVRLVSETAEKKDIAFVEAPTGIGKTISVLYPLISRFGESKQDRIFYLTSKNAIKRVAMSTLSLFEAMGTKCKSIEFTARENICFNDKKGHCNPDECPFARHYYDKLMDTIFDSLELFDTFDRQVIKDICYKREMCPFEFQMDLSRHCDCIVCDYSYVFDFHDRLELSQGSITKTHSTLLVDECHNLPERVRDMYSLELFVKSFEEVLPSLGINEFSSLKNEVRRMISDIQSIYVDYDDVEARRNHVYVLEKIPDSLLSDMDDFIVDMKAILKKHALLVDEYLLNFFYDINSFHTLAEMADDEEREGEFLFYVSLYRDNRIQSIKIANLDSRKTIRECTSFFESAIFFSATLSPKEYYIDLLGGSMNDAHLFLPSPFSMENRRVFIDTRLSLRFQDRDQTLYQVYSLCRNAIMMKKGNYFIFCPSFEYLDRIYSFLLQEPIDEADIYIQQRSMTEAERDEFLDHFSSDNERTAIGLLVLGGVFSEGIDLLGDRLIGAIIISAGIPQVGFERNHIKEYFDKDDEDRKKGFIYAYTYPGINKILQAGGRVIRSEEDRGFIIYIDSRFSHKTYQDIFREIYPDAIKVISPSQVKAELRKFHKEPTEK